MTDIDYIRVYGRAALTVFVLVWLAAPSDAMAQTTIQIPSGSVEATYKYRLVGAEGAGWYSSLEECTGDGQADGYAIYRENATWYIGTPGGQVLYSHTADTEFPPDKGWTAVNGPTPVPTLSGGVSDYSPTDTDATLTAAAGISEPIDLPTTIDTAGEAIGLLDFTITDGGTSDGEATNVSAINIQLSGTIGNASKLTFLLDGPDASAVPGTVSGGTVSFTGLSVSVADGQSETYIIRAYFNDNIGLTDNAMLILSLDGDTDVTTGAGTSFGPTSPVTNGAGSSVVVVATQLAFATQPAGSVSGVALDTQPVVRAEDAFGNVDVDFTETVTLTASSAGSLAGASVAAVSGVATFAALTYTASADQESFTLTADDESGAGSDLPTATSSSVTSDVVATRLVFATEPAPLQVADSDQTSFTTVPVVSAVDADGTVDTDYATDIQLAETGGAGSATLSSPSDSDGNAATVSVSPSDGVATFTGLTISYTTSGGSAETFNLEATSGELNFATSIQMTASVNTAPVAAADAVSTPEDTELSGNVLADNGSGEDSDADGDPLTVTTTPTAGVEHGTLTLGADGSFTYNPDADFNGTDSFTYEVTDGQGGSDTALVTITVTAVNDAPIVSLPAVQTVDEDDSLIFSSGNGNAITITDVDADGGDLELTLSASSTVTLASGHALAITAGSDGSATLTALGTVAEINVALDGLVYVPTANQTTGASLTVSVDDQGNSGSGSALSVTETLTIVINAQNDPPIVVVSQAIAVAEGGTAVLSTDNISGNDLDTDTDSFIYLVTSAPANGQVLVSGSAASTFSHAQLTGGEVSYVHDGSNTNSDEFEIELSDGDLTDSASVTIEVTNSNDAPTISAIANQTIDEDEASSALAFTIADEETAAAALVVSATSSNQALLPNDALVLGGAGAARTITATPLADQHGAATVTVTVSDGQNQSQITFEVDVTPVNDAPTFTAGSDVTVDEDSGNYSAAWASDILPGPANEASQNVTWQVTNSNDALFAALPALSLAGELTFTPAANAHGSSTVTVALKDNGGTASGGVDTSADVTFTITVNSVNDAPVVTSGSAVDVPENTTAVQTVTFTDADPGDSHTFTLTGGADQAAFAIDATTGELAFLAAPDFEANASADGDSIYEVQVTVTDDGAGSLTGVIDLTITVTDVNEAPTLSLSTTTPSIDENNTAPTTVATITVTDDALGTNNLSISGADAASFQIIGTDLQFTAVADHETKSSYAVTVNVDDPTLAANPDDSASLTLTIHDVNEAPTLSLSTTTPSIDENNTAPMTVATITVTDDALGTNNLSLSGADAASFQISGMDLQFTAVADHETKSSYDVTVNVDDPTLAADPDDSASLTLTIHDVNDNAPVLANLPASTDLLEDATNGTSVFTVTATDADVGVNGQVAFSITGGDPASDFSIDAATGEITVMDAPLAVPAGGSYSLEITATDQGAGNHTDVRTLTVNVADVNEPPVIQNEPYSATLFEDASIGTFVVTVAAIDGDLGANATVTYSITSGDTDGAFTIDGSTGEITTAAALDFETTSSYSLEVTAADGGSPSLTDVTTVAVTITDVNEAPTLSLSTTTPSIDENNTAPTTVATITVTDDALGTNNLSLSGADAASFQISGMDLQFTAVADHETKSSYDVTVNVDDPTLAPDPDDSASLTLTIHDVNEAPALSLSTTTPSIDENNAVPTTVATITVTDDALGTNNLSLSGADAASFQISGMNLQFTAVADHETKSSYDVTVNVDDPTLAADPDDSVSLTLTIHDVNEAPAIATIANQTIKEDEATAAIGFTIADPETAAAALVVSATSSNQALLPNAALVLAGAGAARTIAATPLADEHGSATVTVTVSDGQNQSHTTFEVDVTPVNDAPSFTAGSDVTVDEDSGAYSVAWASNILPGPANEASQNVTWQVTNSNDALFAAVPTLGADGTLSFTPADDAHGSSTVTVALKDNGGTASGGVDTSADVTFTITVNPVNDAPTIQAPASIAILEDTPHTFTGATAIMVADVEDDPVTVTLTATSTVQLGSSAGITIQAGADGTETVAIAGSVAEVNAALDGLVYSPSANQTSGAALTVTVSDGVLQQSATTTFTITSVNDTPVAADDAGTTAEDTPLVVDVLANDTDADGDPLAAVITTPPANGTVTANADGTLTYTPAVNFFGADTFSYAATDPDGVTSEAQVTVTVTPVNDAPVALDDAAETNQNTPVTIDVLANDSDIELSAAGEVPQISAVGTPANGTAELNADGTITYTPTEWFFGDDAFTYTNTDGELEATATVSITVMEVNRAPEAADDAAQALQGETILIYPLANDTDPDGDVLTLTGFGAPTAGTVTDNEDGSVTYIAPTDFEGEATFTYTARDPGGKTASATVRVNVWGPGEDGDGAPDSVEDGAPNDGDGNGDGIKDREQENVASFPVAHGPEAGQYLTVAVDGDAILARTGSRANPSVADFPENAVSPVGFVQFDVTNLEPAATTVVTIHLPPGVVATGYLKYGRTADNPEPHWYDFGYDGETGALVLSDKIYLHLKDGARGDDDLSENGIIVDPGTPVFGLNTAPVAVDDVLVLDEDTSADIDVRLNDSDADGDDLIVTVLEQPANGAVSVLPDGSLRYTPNADFFGNDAFTYQLGDSQGGADEAMVQVTVNGVQDAPRTTDDTAETPEGTPVTIDIFANDYDPDGDAFFLTSQDRPQNGTSVYNDDGTVTYTPNPGFAGVDSWTYTTSDGPSASGQTVFGRITVTVTAVQKAPVGGPDEIEGLEDEILVFHPMENDSDSDGDAIMLVSVTQPVEGGSVSLDPAAPETITVTPDADYNGTFTFTYTISDGVRLSDPVLVTMTILPVNDAPTFPVAEVIDESPDATVHLTEPVIIRFREASDVDDTELTYRWEVSTSSAFASVSHAVDVLSVTPEPGGTDTMTTFTMNADTLAQALLLEPGADVTLFQRMVAIDDEGAETASSGQQVTFVRPTSVGNGVTAELPTEVYLSGNYPNPFNPTTTIEFGLPQPMHVSIAIHDMTGRQVRVLVDGMHDAGTYRHRLVLDDLPSGAYIYRMETPDARITKVMHLVK